MIGFGYRVRQSVKRLAGHVLNRVPQRVLAAALPAASRFNPVAPPELSPVPSGERKVYVAPANSAGQGWAWARALERNVPRLGAISMTTSVNHAFRFSTDYAVPLDVYRWSKAWQREQRDNIDDNFTHVIIESGKRLFGDVFPGSTAADIKDMRAKGLAVALLFHGSDIRLPSRHAKSSEWSPFGPGLWALAPQLERIATLNSRLAADSGCRVFVSTPDLVLDVPNATWLPVVVDPHVWAVDSVPLSGGGLPRVAHAPSSGVVKGSDLVDPVLTRLAADGLLEYVRVSGVPAAAMPALYGNVDIVLDQFRIGNYGVAACEAMAAGRIVVSQVSDQVRDYVAEATGLRLPIVDAPADQLEQVLRRIIAEPERYLATASGGVEFVRTVHDGRRSAAAMAGFLAE